MSSSTREIAKAWRNGQRGAVHRVHAEAEKIGHLARAYLDLEAERDALLVSRDNRRRELMAERDALREAIERVLALRSSYEADRGNEVPLVKNYQARSILAEALERHP